MQRPGAEMGSFAENTSAETTGIREFGRHVFEIAALSRASLRRYNLRVWMVGLVWTEPPTPHPVVEPVSDIRVRNGNFRCRDRGPKWAHSRKIRVQRLRESENLADMSLRSRHYRERLSDDTTLECGWWGWYGPNRQLPTQSSNRSLTFEERKGIVE